jgi:hypothetical protein
MKTRKTFLLGTLFAGLVLWLPACSDDDDDSGITGLPASNGQAAVRVAHLSPDAPNVDVWVNGARVLENVAFNAFSTYLDLDPGEHEIQVVPTGETDPKVIDEMVTVGADMFYTVAATGLLAEEDIEPMILVDEQMTSSTMAMIRFIHTSPDAPPVDITLTDGTVLFEDIQFRESADFIPVPAGDYDLQVRLAGTDNVVLSFGDVSVAAGTNYSLFAKGLLADESITALVAVDTEGDGNITATLAPATARLRVAHFSPDAPNVDIYLDDVLVPGLVNVPFEVVSGYLEVSATTHNVKVYVTTTTTDPVINENLTLDPNLTYTVAATGLVGLTDLQPVVLVDWPSAPGDPRVRFSHLSPDAPPVDIVVAGGGPTVFDNVAFRSAAGYDQVGAGTYDLEVRLESDGSLVLPVSGVPLAADRSYTIFAIGLAGDDSLTALLVEDTP